MLKLWTRFLVITLFASAITICESYKIGIISHKDNQGPQTTQIKRILIILPTRIEHVHGINVRYLTLQRELKKRGITVDIMDTSHSDVAIGTLGTMMPEHTLPFSLPRTYLERYLRGVWNESQVERAYDAIHIAEIPLPQSFISCMTFGYYGIPFTMMCHCNYDIYNREYGNFIPDYLYPILGKFFTRKAHAIFAPTPSIVEQLRSVYGLRRKKLVVLPNGIDMNVFNIEHGPEYLEVKDYLENTLKLQRPYLICVSRIAPEKNLEEFFNLDYPGSKIMVGGGPLLDSYRARYPNVTFVGMQRGRKLAAFYQNSNVFVFPSFSETFGIVMIEAMACGLPVAAFPCTGPIDVVDNGITGYLNRDLKLAIDLCLKLDREAVHAGSQRWKIEPTVDIFLNNLVYIPLEARKRLFRENTWF